MTRNKPFLLLALAASLALAACSGLPGGGGGCTTNCTPGTTPVSLVVTADNPPTSPQIISFTASLSGVVLKNSSTGATASLTLSNAQTLDLARLQSDSAFAGFSSVVTSGTYDSATIAISGSNLTIYNNSGAAITSVTPNCAAGAFCQINPAAANSPTITFATPITLSGTGTGIDLDLNLNNIVTLTSGTLAVNFAPTTAALSAIALPRAASSLQLNQLDVIEDFVGVASVSGTSVTITSPTRGALTAIATTSSTSPTIYLPGPDFANPICSNLTLTCVQAGQIASIDAALNTDGTLSLLSYEPLVATAEDLVEGTVVAINTNNQTQFGMIVSDKNVATTSLVSSLNIGDLLTVNLPNTVNPFLVDTKGLDLFNQFPSALSLFQGATTSAPLRPGQSVAVHVSSFVAPVGTTPASVNASALMLRFSRFTSTIASPLTSTTLNVATVPPAFTGPVEGQTFLATSGITIGTRYDGVTDPTSLTSAVALRALFIEDSSNSQQPALFVAKVRKPLNP